jgi:hypothetical protein
MRRQPRLRIIRKTVVIKTEIVEVLDQRWSAEERTAGV